MAAMIRNRKFVRTALAATFGVVMVVASGAAVLAADDQDENLLPDVKFFRSVMRAIGLRNGQEAGVDAHERAPLVLPPTRDLPPPAAPGSLTENNPAWPSDPDVKRRKAQQKMQAEAKPYDYLASGNPLTPTELAAGKTDKPSVKSGDGPDHSPELTPSQLGYVGGLFKSLTSIDNPFSSGKKTETTTFKREPARASLTDPPAGYRSPSPTQPYGVNVRDTNAKATVGDRQTGDFGK
jgi:hypothetical protein